MQSTFDREQIHKIQRQNSRRETVQGWRNFWARQFAELTPEKEEEKAAIEVTNQASPLDDLRRVPLWQIFAVLLLPFWIVYCICREATKRCK